MWPWVPHTVREVFLRRPYLQTAHNKRKILPLQINLSIQLPRNLIMCMGLTRYPTNMPHRNQLQMHLFLNHIFGSFGRFRAAAFLLFPAVFAISGRLHFSSCRPFWAIFRRLHLYYFSPWWPLIHCSCRSWGRPSVADANYPPPPLPANRSPEAPLRGKEGGWEGRWRGEGASGSGWPFAGVGGSKRVGFGGRGPARATWGVHAPKAKCSSNTSSLTSPCTPSDHTTCLNLTLTFVASWFSRASHVD